MRIDRKDGSKRIVTDADPDYLVAPHPGMNITQEDQLLFVDDCVSREEPVRHIFEEDPSTNWSQRASLYDASSFD